MKNVRIDKPCQENWNGMIPTATGAFCQQCATQVLDFTSKSDAEIKAAFRGMTGKSICTRIKASQLKTLNRELETWQLNSPHRIQSAMIFSLVVVFGLSLFSCSSKNEEKTIVKIQTMVTKAWTTPAVNMVPPVEKAALPVSPKKRADDSGIGCAEPLSTPKEDYIIMGKVPRFSSGTSDGAYDENGTVAE